MFVLNLHKSCRPKKTADRIRLQKGKLMPESISYNSILKKNQHLGLVFIRPWCSLSNFRIMIDLESPLSSSALSLVGEVHIGARALLDNINLIWFGNIALLSQWGGGGYFIRSNDFYLPSLRSEEGGWVSTLCVKFNT
jgi:hypothetical protein